MKESEQRVLEDLLPLSDGMFYILLSLSEGENHGYAIMKEVKEKTGNRVRIGPGTLYRSLSKMLEAGLIELLEDCPESEKEDERGRRYYRITSLGENMVLTDVQRRETEVEQLYSVWGVLRPGTTERGLGVKGRAYGYGA